MERNKAAERERLEQERQKCNAEQAVSKHFEESLRRAKEKQNRSAWTINPILPQQHPNQHHFKHNLHHPNHAVSSNVINVIPMPTQSTSKQPSNDRLSQQSRAFHPSHHQEKVIPVQQYVVPSNHDNPMAGPPKMMDKVAHAKNAEPVAANPYANYGYGYTGPTHHYLKNAPKSNCDRMQPNAMVTGNQQQQAPSSNNVAGHKSPDVQVVDVRWPVVEREFDGNGKQVSERIISHGRSFHQQPDKMQSVMFNLMRHQQQQPQAPPPPPHQQQQQYIIQSHRDMSIGPTKVIEKMPHQMKPVEPMAVGSYPNYAYAYPATAVPKQYHKNEAPAKSKADAVLSNASPHISQQQSVGVIVKHDTSRGAPIHISSNQHLTVTHHHQHHHPHQQQQQPQGRQPSPTPTHYATAASIVQNKPKVSSPAPAHIYGRPSSTAHMPQSDPKKVDANCAPLNSRKTFDMPMPATHYGIPAAHHGPPPPPAHSSRSIYESSRIFTTPPSIKAPQQPLPFPIHNSLSSPTNVARPLSHSPGTRASASNPNPSDAMSFQTQPLDLGVSDRTRNNSASPKRKSAPLQHPSTLEMKYKRVKSPSIVIAEQTAPLALKVSTSVVDTSQYHEPPPSAITHIQQNENDSSKSRDTNFSKSSGELSPSLITNSNDSCSSFSYNYINNNNNNNAINSVTINESKTIISSSTSQSNDQLRTSSADGLIRVSSENSSPVASPNSTQSAPATPAKLQSEPEKSNSPALGAPRHLKKAWLQRHTGEDMTGSKITGESIPLVTSSSSPSSSSNEKIINDKGTKTEVVSNSRGTDSVHSFDVGVVAVNTKNKSIGANRSNQSNVSDQNATPAIISRENGQNSESDKQDDSSSSDQSSNAKIPLKRKCKRGRRRFRKVARDKKKRVQAVGSAGASESDKESRGSDKETMSDNDSDSTSTSQGKKSTNCDGANGDAVESNGNGKDRDADPVKRPRPSRPSRSSGQRRRFASRLKSLPKPPPISQLKRTGETFLQIGPCFEVAPKLIKCRECRPEQRSKNSNFCRFEAFRKLRYTKNGLVASSGFSDPIKDPTEDELKLWMSDTDKPPKDLDMMQARYLLEQVADEFCDLYSQEQMAKSVHMSEDKVIAWKRVVEGVRELCDVCDTTLFNCHWSCGKCGFAVCIDCYKARKDGTVKVWNETGRDRDEFCWLLCTNGKPHEQDKLMMAQIIAGDSLEVLGRRVHETCALWNIPQYCGCPMSKELPTSPTYATYKELIKTLMNDAQEKNGNASIKRDSDTSDGETKKSTIVNGTGPAEKEDNKANSSFPGDSVLKSEGGKQEIIDNDENPAKRPKFDIGQSDDFKMDFSDSSSSDDEEGHSTLRDLLIGTNTSSNKEMSAPPDKKPPKKSSKLDFQTIMASTLENKVASNESQTESAKKVIVTEDGRVQTYIPPRVMTLSQSKIEYSGVPHSWLCDGRLLRLIDPTHAGNLKIFQDQWSRSQPVIVSEVTDSLDMNIWRPESFSKDFGDDANDLVNCMTGTLVPNQPMKRFWDGFDYMTKRIKDDNGVPMLLKLKDWPPGEDFAEILPTRFQDLMKSLPLGDYTKRNGRFNLTSHLPECFVKPDLGPKMYNAYGSALYPTKGTTNIHLDISDAVNVMVYVSIPKDTGDRESYIKEAYRAIDAAGCDILTRRRVREKDELAGALWHIYAPRDADKIRDLLNKVAIERGEKLEPNHDAIHDQSWYLDSELRERLYKEYGVEGYPIAQCLGDAVFIPAGAPHQVRNLHNCIKVAEDFVSPENVSKCLRLTHEFRALSDTHSNHEDKLQIKNILYHAVKDALACLSFILAEQARAHHLITDVKEERPVKTEEPDVDLNVIADKPLVKNEMVVDEEADRISIKREAEDEEYENETNQPEVTEIKKTDPDD